VIHRDRCRTAINVWGDSVGTGIVHHLTKNQLEDENVILDDISIDKKYVEPIVQVKL
jgi:Na+/H+-dicarboxylate symporter